MCIRVSQLSKRKCTTFVKPFVLASNQRNEQYNTEALFDFADQPGVLDFVFAPLAQQYKIQRSQKLHPKWSPDAEKALQEIKLLPQSLHDFVLTPVGRGLHAFVIPSLPNPNP